MVLQQVVFLDISQSPDQRVYSFERLNAPDEQDHAVFTWSTDHFHSFVAWDGKEVLRIHTGGDGHQLVHLAVVQKLQL